MKRIYQQYLEATQQILDQSKKETMPYETTVADRVFVVFPNVFSPKYFRDTELFARNLPVRPGEKLLEIGSGTGAVAITALYKGASHIVATDINADAVRNTQANIDLHNAANRAEVRQGNLFDPLAAHETFDIIFWNVPFGFVCTDEVSDLEKAVYDPHYRSIEQFIKQAGTHLKDNGRVVIGFSTTLGRLDLLEKFCAGAGLQLRLIYKAHSEEMYPVKFELFEATLCRPLSQ